MLQLIRSLEISLHQNGVRNDAAQLQALLHDDFMEIGRSGHSYNKAQMIAHLTQSSPHAAQSSPHTAQGSTHTAVWAQDFKLTMPAYSVALLTYHSAQTDADDQLTLCTARSSLWQLADTGWQLLFHQGTPVPEFERSYHPAELLTHPLH